MVSQTPPARRHFFVHLGPHGATCVQVPVRRLGSWMEASAITSFARQKHVRRLLVVSAGSHLRRALAALCAQQGAGDLSFHPVAVPAGSTTHGARDPEARIGYLLLELGKYFLYRVVAWASWRPGTAGT